MSEKMYIRLLRLYPSGFRKQFEGEALQLIRDRLRDETGFFKRARLWWDLATDVLAGLPQAYRNSYADTEAAALSPSVDGVPSFKILDKEPLRHGSILVGGTVSVVAIAAFGFALNHPLAYQPIPGSNTRMSPIESVMQRLNRPTPPDAALGARKDVSSPVLTKPAELPANPTAATAPSLSLASSPPEAKPDLAVVPFARNSKSQPLPSPGFVSPSAVIRSERQQAYGSNTSGFPGRTAKSVLISNQNLLSIRSRTSGTFSAPYSPQTATSAKTAPSTGETSLSASERHRVIDAAAANLRKHYFDRNVAQTTADALMAHEKSGDDDAARDGAAFANLLTGQMREASHDMHLIVEYSPDILPEHPPQPTPENLAPYRNAMRKQNCMFRKVELLPHNIGYFKLDSFPDTSVCEATARAAMASLNHADAIVFDLRDNTGGFPDMVSLIASYLFDHPEYMYSPRGTPDQNSWTQSPVPGSLLADKPVYVLTSTSTWSGAEQFSYDLKMLKRATLVGETTRGGAHAGVFHRIDDHFGIGIPEEKPINPFGSADWEGVGVQPDVKVNASNALRTALHLAERKLQSQH
jgi:hypothetical protein